MSGQIKEHTLANIAIAYICIRNGLSGLRPTIRVVEVVGNKHFGPGTGTPPGSNRHRRVVNTYGSIVSYNENHTTED